MNEIIINCYFSLFDKLPENSCLNYIGIVILMIIFTKLLKKSNINTERLNIKILKIFLIISLITLNALIALAIPAYFVYSNIEIKPQEMKQMIELHSQKYHLDQKELNNCVFERVLNGEDKMVTYLNRKDIFVCKKEMQDKEKAQKRKAMNEELQKTFKLQQEEYKKEIQQYIQK